MLPQFTSDTLSSNSNAQNSISQKFLKSYLFKMLRPHKHQMDFDLALFLMKYSLKGPNKLYLHTKRLKQIKKAVIVFSLFILGVLYSLSVNIQTDFISCITGAIITGFNFVFKQFFMWAVIISAVNKIVAEKFMIKGEKKQNSNGSTGGENTVKNTETKNIAFIEPMYAFDVYCNSFFPFMVIQYLGQLILLPVLWREGFLSCLLSNCLLLTACVYYFFITFRGYAVLPFLRKQEYFLLPVGIIGVGLFVMTLLGINQTHIFVTYFVQL
ncbi:hypothetical protein FGO68_gene2888 [Halteria grandinella]|uniref:Uncharacterized protein n=1 Tax=Halteria grandinella TaxID=5974 RepID=A0A8J8SZP1_HALGN|nr:hypothetical protein FGO68_gene2888 [Halteria grandinella]